MDSLDKMENWWNKHEKKIIYFLVFNMAISMIISLFTNNKLVRNYFIVVSIGLPWLLVTIAQGYHQNSESKIENDINEEEKYYSNFLKDRPHDDIHKKAKLQVISQLYSKLGRIKNLNEMFVILTRTFKMFSLFFAIIFFCSDSFRRINNYLLKNEEKVNADSYKKINAEKIQKLNRELQLSNIKIDSINNQVTILKSRIIDLQLNLQENPK